MLWAWTRSSRRSRPATVGLCHPRPEVAYPAICLPGTGCDGSYRPGGVGSATLCGCKLWPVFGQIKQGRGFRQFLLRGLEKVNGEWSLICTGHNLLKLFRFGVNPHRKARVDGSAQRIRNFCLGSEHDAIRKAIWGPAGATGKISCRDPLSLTRKHR